MADQLMTISDREVEERLRIALGEPLFCGHPPGYSSNDTIFAYHVIPALEARGLGEKWANRVLTLDGWKNLQARYAIQCAWAVAKAPLSLRARAALTVLEAANG